MLLLATMGILCVLWLPGLKYPIISDTARYAFLGESLWMNARYELFGEPYALHLPFHAFISYPFVRTLGFSVGMKVSSLFAGMMTLLATYILLSHVFHRKVALLSTIAIAFHHGFLLMTMLGSADLLFTALFLFSVYCYMRADDDATWYVPAFLLAGCACVTRYNGVPLWLLFAAHIIISRRGDVKHPVLYGAGAAGASIFALWLARNAYVFGNPLHTQYASEYAAQGGDVFEQLFSNVLYYLNPLHNILPFFLALSFFGLWRFGREHRFLVAAMCTAWVITAIWWVQAIRFAFPGYPILMGFAVMGLFELWDVATRTVTDRLKTILRTCIVVMVVFMHVSALCVYAYGECNAAFDRYIGLVPKNLGLTSEGFYAWHQARDHLMEVVKPGDRVFVADPVSASIWDREHVFGATRVVTGHECAVYRIAQHPHEDAVILWSTLDEPVTHVTRQECI